MANKYVTTAGAGEKDGTDWDNAFGTAEFKTDLEGSAAAGDIYFIESGTYTISSAFNWSNQDGTGASPIKLIGVNTGTTAEPPTVSDYASGNDRPLMDVQTNFIICGDYCWLQNLRWSTSSAVGFRTALATLALNSYFENDSGAAGQPALDCFGAYNHIMDTEMVSISGIGVRQVTTFSTTVRNCYMRDSQIGAQANQIDFAVINSIIDSCDTGLDLNGNGTEILNNTIYNSTKGIDGTMNSSSFINNTISNCTSGVVWNATADSNYWDYNNFHNNSVDRHNVTAGTNDTANDPDFVNASGGDFSLNTTSNLIDAGQSITLGVG